MKQTYSGDDEIKDVGNRLACSKSTIGLCYSKSLIDLACSKPRINLTCSSILGQVP
jgi:hypothetical protein